jgi:pimeloyl-ACP methyl ester carboxylesterase
VNFAGQGPPATFTRLPAADGVRLHAAHVPAAGRSGVAYVVAHGFTGSFRRPAVQQIVTRLAADGGVVTFDFRGHGESGGMSTLGDLEVLDVDAAVGWARELGYGRVVTVGWSMGGAVVVRHAGLLGGADAVVSVSAPSRWYYKGTPPMRRLHWVVERRLGRLVSRYALGTRVSADGWDPVPPSPVELAGQIAPVPLLVVHGDRDTYFPVDHAEALYEAAGDPKELWIERGFGHAEAAADPALVRRIAAWGAAAADRADGN